MLAGTLEVRGLDEAEAAELERAWAWCEPERAAGGDGPVARAGDGAAAGEAAPARVVCREQLDTLDRDTFMEHVVSTATTTAIGSRRGERILLHGAALAHPTTGATIALVAPSGTGKTTATRTLGQRLGYLTDETVSIDAALAVEPFAKPLSLLERGRRPKTQRSPDALGLRRAPQPGRLAVIAVLRRDAEGDAAAARVERLGLAEALAAIIAQSSSLFALPRGLVALCEAIDACGGAVALHYREAERLAPLVDGLLAGGGAHDAGDASGVGATAADAVGEGPGQAGAAEPSSWSPLEPERWRLVDDEPSGLGLSGVGPWVRRREPADAIELDGGVALLDANGFVVLGGPGRAVWSAASRWSTLDELVGLVVETLGPHPQAEGLVASAVDELVERGVLERRHA